MEELLKASDIGFRHADDCPLLFSKINFKLKRGETLCITGRSGIGKSTLLRILAMSLAPTEGKIEYNINNNSTSLLNYGFVFQDPRLLPWRNAYQNISLPLENSKLDSAETSARINNALTQVGLIEIAARYPHQLSGGQQQRVSLARALVTNAPLLLLDEPFSALDLESKEEMCKILESLIEDQNLGIVLVTHDMKDIDRFGARSLRL